MTMLTANFPPQYERPLTLPRWMRAALWTTAVLNLFGAIMFVPGFSMVRNLVELPSAVHPLYLWIIAEFIFIMGIGYGYCAWVNRAPLVFIAVGAMGKLSFAITLIGFWLVGNLPLKVPLLAGADLLLGSLFLMWLIRANRSVKQQISPFGDQQ